jgi:hypothetical protein
MKLVVNGEEVLKRSGLENAHQLALKSRVSYPTVERYINTPEKSVSLDTGVLASILLEGLGLTQEAALNLRLGDLFKFVK